MGYQQPDNNAVAAYATNESSAVQDGSGQVLSPEVESLIEEHKRQRRLAEGVEYERDRELTRQQGKRAADEELERLRKIVPVKASLFTARRTRWLWRDRVPLGGLALLAGKGDVSKSTLFACFCAWLTTGDMKGEFYGTPQHVLYVVNEDSINETVVPRMIAHGADLERIHFLSVESPLGKDALLLPRDAELLKDCIKSTGAVATFIDPLSANVSGRSNDQRETRNTYQVVNSLAEETMTSIMGLAHTRKAGAADVMEAIIGSSEQGNVARSVHGLVMDPDEDGARILSCEKLNVGQKHLLPSLRFEVVSELVRINEYESTSAPRVQWLEETTDTASGVLADQLSGDSGRAECARWLLGLVQQNGGEMFFPDVESAAGRKYSVPMLKRARVMAGIKSKREKAQAARAIWYLPEASDT